MRAILLSLQENSLLLNYGLVKTGLKGTAQVTVPRPCLWLAQGAHLSVGKARGSSEDLPKAEMKGTHHKTLLSLGKHGFSGTELFGKNSASFVLPHFHLAV